MNKICLLNMNAIMPKDILLNQTCLLLALIYLIIVFNICPLISINNMKKKLLKQQERNVRRDAIAVPSSLLKFQGFPII